MIVFGAVMLHKMFDAGTKLLSATDDQLKVHVGEEIQYSNHRHVYSLNSHYANPPKCIVDAADI